MSAIAKPSMCKCGHGSDEHTVVNGGRCLYPGCECQKSFYVVVIESQEAELAQLRVENRRLVGRLSQAQAILAAECGCLDVSDFADWDNVPMAADSYRKLHAALAEDEALSRGNGEE